MPPSNLPAPFADPLLPQLPLPSPFTTPKHLRLRAFVRNYVDTHLAPQAQEWETAGLVPPSVYQTHCSQGFSIVHPITKPEYAGGVSLPAGIPYEEWDVYCSVIVGDEFSRLGWCGVTWGLGGGNGIGCPPIARFGTEEQKKRWLPGVAQGKIRFCLGITEPEGGSDVANIQTTAERRRNKDGEEVYVVNGAKKWITNGLWADYCTTAVRTGGKSHGGISLLVVPLSAKGVRRTRIENQGVHASGEFSFSCLLTADVVDLPTCRSHYLEVRAHPSDIS
jgi:alkylation response protein AidB-like acyl-CoA dehydrogenase